MQRTVVDRHHRSRPENVCSNCRLLGRERGFVGTCWLKVWPLADCRIDRQEREIEWAIPVRDPPSEAVKQRVPGMEDATPAAFDDPTDLGIAEAIDGRCRRNEERTNRALLPCRNDLDFQ